MPETETEERNEPFQTIHDSTLYVVWKEHCCSGTLPTTSGMRKGEKPMWQFLPGTQISVSLRLSPSKTLQTVEYMVSMAQQEGGIFSGHSLHCSLKWNVCFPLPWEIDGGGAPATSLSVWKTLYRVFSFQYVYTRNWQWAVSNSKMRDLRLQGNGSAPQLV